MTGNSTFITALAHARGDRMTRATYALTKQ
jgi:hypothetical protein